MSLIFFCITFISQIIMNHFILRFRKMALQLTKWQNSVAPKVELWIDKYKIVKVGCVLGIAINSYFIYDGLITAIALKRVQKQVQEKKAVFYKRIESKRELVLALMQELDNTNTKNTQLQGKVANQ